MGFYPYQSRTRWAVKLKTKLINKAFKSKEGLNRPALPRLRHLCLLQPFHFLLTNFLSPPPSILLVSPIFLSGTILRGLSGGKLAFDFPQARGCLIHPCLSPDEDFFSFYLRNQWAPGGPQQLQQGVSCPQGIPAAQVEDGCGGKEGSREDMMVPFQYTDCVPLGLLFCVQWLD